MSDEFDRLLGRRLRQRRRLLGLSQAQVGGACGVRFQQIQKYETAGSRVSAQMLCRLAIALGVDANYLLSGLAAACVCDAAEVGPPPAERDRNAPATA